MELLKIHHEHFFSKGIRVDGRKFNEFRDLLVNIDSIETADSSIVVKIGSTTVMCGIKVTLNEDVKALESVNYSDLIDLEIALHPLDEDKGEREEINSLLVKLIKGNVLFDHKPLICEDEDGERQYLTLNIELICLNNDGNVLDAFIIAFLGAINSLKFPDYKSICDENLHPQPTSKPSRNNAEYKRLNVLKFPISITAALMSNGNVLVDPNRDEEQLATGLISIVFDVATEKIIMIEKQGGTPMDDVSLLKHISFSKSMATKFFKTMPILQSKGEAMET
ncbi:exosome complex component RRP43 [Tetranychus urticae]|uniref:Ribosomal RNA-processing protein 43 n=1 Tax=Tetranychus urticae TaxID=32264 RepID=T1KM73_TETUR|nr:exosome complex component RRP43 [Tetranychus urticae]XP_015788679.1 exosome complex component RRP43 [Tetranychus urticae]